MSTPLIYTHIALTTDPEVAALEWSAAVTATGHAPLTGEVDILTGVGRGRAGTMKVEGLVVPVVDEAAEVRPERPVLAPWEAVPPPPARTDGPHRDRHLLLTGGAAACGSALTTRSLTTRDGRLVDCQGCADAVRGAPRCTTCHTSVLAHPYRHPITLMQ